MNCTIAAPSSLRDSGVFDDGELAQLWDFYVTKRLAVSQPRKTMVIQSQSRTLADYKHPKASCGNLWKLAGATAGRAILLKADTMYQTLISMNFYTSGKKKEPVPLATIPIDEPRWCALQLYEIHDVEKPRAKAGDGDIYCLFRHVRNALAHGSTYVLGTPPNQFILLADNDRSKPTARILIRPQTLVDWVKYIDINGLFYFKEDDRSGVRKLLS